MTYPYLGSKEFDDGTTVVVFFTSDNKGVIVYSDKNDDRYTFGKNDVFDEEDFSFYPEGLCVRLNN